jgi:hypothetical protein
MNASLRHGWYDARARLGGAWLASALSGALVCVGLAGLMEAQAVGGASSARQIQLRLLEGAAFGLVVPLFAFFASARLGGRLEELLGSAWPRYGADRRLFALGRLAFPTLVAGVVAVSCAALALGLGSASSDPALRLPFGLATQLGTVAWIGALAGASYVAGLGLAQLLGGAWGRALFLTLDWLLGAGGGVTALPWPRAHLRALLGGEPVLGMTSLEATGCLLALTLIYALLYARRVPR